ncbi:hypothetical protein OIO90_006096 [Microbotryomycetes sp. JL221]|nr:hypothetical protein OIO90_006096 [Microbotryomycetes sp. JL221]
MNARVTALHDQLCQAIDKVLKRTNLKRHVDKIVIECLPVVIGIKTATLIDNVFFDQQQARQLSNELNKITKKCSVAYESLSQTTFIVNLDLVRQKNLNFEQDPWFLLLSKQGPCKLNERPNFLISILQQFQHSNSSSFLLIQLQHDSIYNEFNKQIIQLVTVAGFLLDYLICYVVDLNDVQNSFNCLNGLELILVNVNWSCKEVNKGQHGHSDLTWVFALFQTSCLEPLARETTKHDKTIDIDSILFTLFRSEDHELMNFSFPLNIKFNTSSSNSTLIKQDNVDTESIINELKTRLESRVMTVRNEWGQIETSVKHSHVTLDRVAL